MDAALVQARRAAWYSAYLGRVKDFPALDVWLGEKPAGMTPDDWARRKAEHEELLRRTGERQ